MVSFNVSNNVVEDSQFTLVCCITAGHAHQIGPCSNRHVLALGKPLLVKLRYQGGDNNNSERQEIEHAANVAYPEYLILDKEQFIQAASRVECDFKQTWMPIFI